MRCPSAVAGFCPSTDNMNIHHSEWTSEYYCTTCGHEAKIKHERPQRVKLQTTAVTRPKSKYQKDK